MPEMICPHCRGDAEPYLVEEALGRSGNARVRITGLPVVRCTYCQKSAPRYSEFIADMARILAGTSALPTAPLVGLFRKQPGCRECKTPLEGGLTGPANFQADLELIDPPFHADFSILTTSCPQCDTAQVVLRGTPVEHDIACAIRRALESVAVTLPTGTPAYSQ